ncbi:site-specific DNA-methyltransferase [Gemmata sp. G18]|uniref:site-specific DNA-methyltransferase (adenine-specific) n=1 Tax=Gemmata palustris TaxID=2822762 RepID=A0ABS5BNE3_9BACT|nr:site-specific DNA-methyltransferase [Gemmata palustris]MBP3954388.1 site-specific DNA-methyltransferase [Gemmata palustris]
MRRKGGIQTPKPEALIERIIHIASNPGEIVLDSFAGSGTTGAVAHKMGRRWIMVELGALPYAHHSPPHQSCRWPRLGRRYRSHWLERRGRFPLLPTRPSLLMKDKWSQWVISKEYNAAMLSEALLQA